MNIKNIFLTIFVIIFVTACNSVIPEIDKNYIPDITMQDLAVKMVNAIDPNGVYKQSKSYYMRQEMINDHKIITYEVLYKAPNKFKITMSMDKKILQKTTCNGIKCWNCSEKGEKTELSGLEFERLKLLEDMGSSNGTILDIFDKVEFAGEDEISGTACYILICYPKVKGIEPIVRYVSKSDYLVRKLITIKNAVPYIADITKYVLFSGVMIPAEAEMDINNDGKRDLMKITDYKLDLDISDTEFE